MPKGKSLRGTLCAIALLIVGFGFVHAGEAPQPRNYKVLPPITHGGLTIFPVVAASSYDATEFLTLDEGLRSGEIVITEAGRVQPLIRGHAHTIPFREGGGGAQVNQLVLVNNSKRPLLLLAGEIVTGGKQDRVIGKDRIVPVGSDPIDLSVFCVEPGRWTAVSDKFGSLGAAMAQPSVRRGAMAAKNQQRVWDEVRKSNETVMALAAPAATGSGIGGGIGGGSRDGLAGTTSYARVMNSQDVKQRVDAVAAPMARDYESVIRELRERNAVGVVVAVNGDIIWADIFASTALLQKYWPKLSRSYAAESVVARASGKRPEIADAQKFLSELSGKREVVESEPGVYRHTEISGADFKVFELTSLLPKTGFDLHLAKMAE
jgi:hypothetical protein